MQLTCKIRTCCTIPVTWMNQCQKAFEKLKDILIKTPILVYTDLTQEHTTVIDGQTLSLQHPMTYASGLFQGS